ncbi:hypothetical protein PENSPDRAFT_759679 [Peniophora sp. CONT]|nr:hypothetical protein PENSPDRAFT_759679 [Peniophora sp. CONT]
MTAWMQMFACQHTMLRACSSRIWRRAYFLPLPRLLFSQSSLRCQPLRMPGTPKRLWSDLDGSTYFPRKRIHNALVQFLGLRGQSQPPQSTNWPGRLPDDILCDIFRLIIEDHFSQSDALFASTVVPQMALGRVCRQWRFALHDIRSAWISIPTCLSPSQVGNSAQNSRGLPLRIGVEFSRPDLCSTQEWSRARLQQELLHQFDSRFTHLFTTPVVGDGVYLADVRELAVSTSSYVLSELAAQNLWCKRRFPHVDTLHIAMEVVPPEETRVPPSLRYLCRSGGHTPADSLLWTRDFPSLWKLRLDRVVFPGSFLGLPEGLRHLELNMASRVQRDILGVPPVDVLAYIFRELKVLPQLQYLSLNFGDVPINPSGLEIGQALVATLHSLREINLTATSALPLQFMSSASLPALLRCTLKIHYPDLSSINPTPESLETSFCIFLRQLAIADVRLRSVYVGYHHCPMSIKAAVFVMASTEPVDWTDPASVRSFSENANLNCTISWDRTTHRSDGKTAETFLNTLLLSLPSHASDTHPIDTLAFSDGGGCLSSTFCYATLFECAPFIHTLACYGRDEAMLHALELLGDESETQYARRCLKTLVFNRGLDGERRPGVCRRFGALETPVWFAGSEPARVLREAAMKMIV